MIRSTVPELAVMDLLPLGVRQQQCRGCAALPTARLVDAVVVARRVADDVERLDGGAPRPPPA